MKYPYEIFLNINPLTALLLIEGSYEWTCSEEESSKQLTKKKRNFIVYAYISQQFTPFLESVYIRKWWYGPRRNVKSAALSRDARISRRPGLHSSVSFSSGHVSRDGRTPVTRLNYTRYMMYLHVKMWPKHTLNWKGNQCFFSLHLILSLLQVMSKKCVFDNILTLWKFTVLFSIVMDVFALGSDMLSIYRRKIIEIWWL